MSKNLIMKKTMILEKPSATVSITDPMSAIQRKFYNAFLYVAKENLIQDPNKQEFKIPLPELKKFFEIEDKKNTYLKERIEELVKLTAQYNILNKDNEEWGIFSILPFVKIYIDNKTKTGIVKFEIPTPIKNAILNKEKNLFAKIDLIIIRGLKSKYSIILYELLKDYENVEIPEMDLDKFREIFGVKNKYKIFQDLKKRVLDPAIKELNSNPNIDWNISYKLKKLGPKYTHIKFTKTKKQKQQQLASTATQQKIDLLISKIPSKIQSEAVSKLIHASLKKYSFEYLQAQIEYTNKKYQEGKIENYGAYLRQAIQEDYAEHKMRQERLKKAREERERRKQEEEKVKKQIAELKKRKEKIEEEAEKEFEALPIQEQEKRIQKHIGILKDHKIARMTAVGEIMNEKMQKEFTEEELELLGK